MSLLEVTGLSAGYGAADVLHEVNVYIEPGELVTVIGSNGAGKSTLLRTISGLVTPSAGTIVFDGRDVTSAGAPQLAAAGVAHVPENRRVFAKDPVEDNLRLGAWLRRRKRAEVDEDLTRVFEQFPILKERRRQQAGALSGGQQQMLAIGMALMARPKLLMMDEPSLGLAPILVEQIFAEIERLKGEGMTILLVEQLAEQALRVADRGAVLQLGRIRVEGTAEQLRNNPEVAGGYLG